MTKIKNVEKGVLYKLTLVAAVAQPLMSVPQAVQLYTTQEAAGLSLWTWLGYAAFGMVFLAYGLKYRLLPIIVTQIIWLCFQLSIVIGILLWQ